MIKDFIFIEDGSVDMDELDGLFSEETKVVVYRQGASKPIIEHLAEPIEYSFEANLKREAIVKETAYKVLLRLLEESKGNPYLDFDVIQDITNKIAKEYDVEIKE